MTVDFTAFDAQLTGTNGAAGSPSGTIDGGDGGNAIESLAPYSNTDFSLEPSLSRVFPTVTGRQWRRGRGRRQRDGDDARRFRAASAAKAARRSSRWTTISLAPRRHHYAGFVTITASVDASVIGSAGGGTAGAGGAGGRGGLGITMTTGVNGSKDSRGSDGAGGGAGGIGEVANADVTAMISYATSDLQIQLITNGGKGGQGGSGGSGGNGSLSAGNGGNGAAGGAGAPAEATFSGATAFNDSAIFVIEKPDRRIWRIRRLWRQWRQSRPGRIAAHGLRSEREWRRRRTGWRRFRDGVRRYAHRAECAVHPEREWRAGRRRRIGRQCRTGSWSERARGKRRRRIDHIHQQRHHGRVRHSRRYATSGSDLLLLNLRVATFGPAGFFSPARSTAALAATSPSPATRSSATAHRGWCCNSAARERPRSIRRPTP